MEWFATLLTDMPLNERRFRGLLLDIAENAGTGAIRPEAMVAHHFFTEATQESAASDLEVRLRTSSPTVPKHILQQLLRQNFRPTTALEFWIPRTSRKQESAWQLLQLYCFQLSGWVYSHKPRPKAKTEGSPRLISAQNLLSPNS